MSKPKKIRYDHLTFRLAEWEEEARIIAFVNENFDMALPLVNNENFFRHYYCGTRLQFALAEQDGVLVAAAGYILANQRESPDIWVSVWIAIKGAMGAGLELMNAIPALTNAHVVACNNIRENTCPFYRFLGWEAERLPHYYRLSAAAIKGNAQLYHPAMQDGKPLLPTRLAVTGDLHLQKVEDTAQLAALGLPQNNAAQRPTKDLTYLAHRYFEYPYFSYDVWSVQEEGALLAYCVTRTVEAYLDAQDTLHDAQPCQNTSQETIPVLRIVDFIGASTVLPRIGTALDTLLETSGAEYIDCYCAGFSAQVFAAAGFSERVAESSEIVPNYLTPALIANTEYFYFTNQPEAFTMFKADGDQDRPNLL